MSDRTRAWRATRGCWSAARRAARPSYGGLAWMSRCRGRDPFERGKAQENSRLRGRGRGRLEGGNGAPHRCHGRLVRPCPTPQCRTAGQASRGTNEVEPWIRLRRPARQGRTRIRTPTIQGHTRRLPFQEGRASREQPIARIIFVMASLDVSITCGFLQTSTIFGPSFFGGRSHCTCGGEECRWPRCASGGGSWPGPLTRRGGGGPFTAPRLAPGRSMLVSCTNGYPEWPPTGRHSAQRRTQLPDGARCGSGRIGRCPGA